jgi:methionine-rich copper-binding protein CopC
MMKTKTCAFALLACLVSGGSAWAHARLRAETPAAGGTVATSPPALLLTFSEGLELKLSGVTLKGPDDKLVPTGAASLGPGGDKLMTVLIDGELGAGKYTVELHALSKDGHTTHGSYQFTVGP